MHTITLKVRDDFLPKFMSLLEIMPKNKVKIQKGPIELELERRIQEIEDASKSTVPFETMWENIEKRIETCLHVRYLQKNY